jgi:hypothetical protein
MIRGSGAEAVSFGDPSPEVMAQSAQRAKSLAFPAPAAPELPARVSALPLTESDARERARAAADRIGAAAAWVASGGVTAGHRPSVTEARVRIHERAAGWNAWLAKAGVYLWGYLIYLPAHAALMAADATLEVFTWFVVAGGVAVLTWFFLLRG